MPPTTGPGYASPMAAFTSGPREELLYVVCVQPNQAHDRTDLLATVDVDPNSPTYQQIIHKLQTGRMHDELHHSGWNVCSSCHKCAGSAPVRDKLVLPAIGSSRVYIVDTGAAPRAPRLHHVVEAGELLALDCATPHTAHCLADGHIMVSTLGDAAGNGKCDYVLIDSATFEVRGTWARGAKRANFNYDFWYQPHFDAMISTEWAAPKVFKRGYKPNEELDTSIYGRSLNFFSWSTHELIQTIDLGVDGVTPLETRFLHDPRKAEGFVGCALNANVYHFYQQPDKTWTADKVIDVKGKRVANWPSDQIQGAITDILLSLDDKFLYLSNWLHGDVRQYDVTDPRKPVLTGQVFLGGQIVKGSKVEVVADEELSGRPEPVVVKGRRLYGGPQMMQLSLDGRRLYVSSSLFTPWDRQFYPETIEKGATIVKLDIDHERGGMKLDEEFLVDFGNGPEGPLMAHEMRYPGGDCTSDIWLAN